VLTMPAVTCTLELFIPPISMRALAVAARHVGEGDLLGPDVISIEGRL
jgi:hypothetical protein